MSRKLSKENIVSYIGDILPLHIGFNGDEHEYLKSADIKWECDSDCVALRDFRGEDKMCFNNGGFGGNNCCLWIILILILICCCGGGCGNVGGVAGGNCGNNCACTCHCTCNDNCGC